MVVCSQARDNCYPRCSHVESSRRTPYQKEQGKKSVIALADASTKPYAVVVKALHAKAALVAVLGSRGAVDRANLAHFAGVHSPNVRIGRMAEGAFSSPARACAPRGPPQKDCCSREGRAEAVHA